MKPGETWRSRQACITCKPMYLQYVFYLLSNLRKHLKDYSLKLFIILETVMVVTNGSVNPLVFENEEYKFVNV